MENVILAKTLGETDVTRRCAVRMKYFKKKRFPKFEGRDKVDFVVKDESGKYHTLCCSKRKIGNDPKRPKHPKPVLIGGWIPFVREKKLRVGDTVIIFEEQDETGLMERRIKVERQTSNSEARCSPVMSQDHEGIKGSTTSNRTFQPFGVLSSDVLNPDQSGIDDATSSIIEEEQTPNPQQYFSDTACCKIEGPDLSLNLELTLKPTITGGSPAAASSSIQKEQAPLPHITCQDTACYGSERSILSLSLSTSNPTMTGGQQHAYIQKTEPKTINFLGSFLSGLKAQ